MALKALWQGGTLGSLRDLGSCMLIPRVLPAIAISGFTYTSVQCPTQTSLIALSDLTAIGH